MVELLTLGSRLLHDIYFGRVWSEKGFRFWQFLIKTGYVFHSGLELGILFKKQLSPSTIGQLNALLNCLRKRKPFLVSCRTPKALGNNSPGFNLRQNYSNTLAPPFLEHLIFSCGGALALLARIGNPLVSAVDCMQAEGQAFEFWLRSLCWKDTFLS